MKILVICPLTTDSGGSVTSWSIAEQLANLGHKVFFTERGFLNSPKRNSSSVKYLRSIDIVPVLPLNILVSMIFNTLAVLFIRADVVFTLKPLPNACFPAMVAKLLGAKTILHINDLDHEFYKGIFKKIMCFFYRFFPRFFDRVSFPSINLKEYVQRDLGLEESRLILLPQGVDWAKFQKTAVNGRLKKELGLINCRTIVYVASFGIGSNFERITELFSKIVEELENIKFLVIGSGSNLERFKKIVHDFDLDGQVIFTGYISHDEIPHYLALGDIGINYMEDKKANHFRVPIKVKEYLAAGLPVVTNDMGDYYLLQDYIDIAKDDEELIKQVKQILSDERKIDITAIEQIKKIYDWKTIIAEFNQTLEEIIACNNKGE